MPLYNHFAYVSDPLAKKYDDWLHVFDPGEISFSNGTFHVDENPDGISDYNFRKPDFNFVQFRSNLIVRWENRADSELYLVWSQGYTPDSFADLIHQLQETYLTNAFAEQARNIF